MTADQEAIRKFLSTASHELRSPLASIGGFATTMLHYWDSMSDDERRGQLEIIARQSRRMERLIKNLVTLSQLDSGALHTEPIPVSVIGAARQAIGEDSTGVRIDSREDLEAFSDPDHLHRILEEFVENARNHGSPPIEITAAADSQTVTIRVCDAGAGPPEALVPSLFERFSRGGSSSSGSGLGLAVAKHLAEANGGEVWFSPGECFGVRLPRAPSNMR